MDDKMTAEELKDYVEQLAAEFPDPDWPEDPELLAIMEKLSAAFLSLSKADQKAYLELIPLMNPDDTPIFNPGPDFKRPKPRTDGWTVDPL
jgi:hypothetical protein